MALKKNTNSNKENATDTTAAPAEEKAPVKDAPAKEEAKAPTKAVAKKAPAATPAEVAGSEAVFIMNPALRELAAEAKYGDFPSIVASNGAHSMRTASGKVSLGETLEFQAIHAKPIWKVSPGETDEAAKEFFKVSYDGDVCEDGTPIQDALMDAEEAGYSKAKITRGTDVVVLIRKCEKDPSQEGELRTLQLSPSSNRNWTPLAKNVQAKAVLGMLKAVPIMEGHPDKAVMFRSIATASTGEYDYTYMDFELV